MDEKFISIVAHLLNAKSIPYKWDHATQELLIQDVPDEYVEPLAIALDSIQHLLSLNSTMPILDEEGNYVGVEI